MPTVDSCSAPTKELQSPIMSLPSVPPHRPTKLVKVRNAVCLLIALGAATPLPAAEPPSARPDRAAFEFFETRIRPVLVEHCYECHSVQAKKPKGGLRLDSRDGLRKGGDSGPAVVLGKPDDSLLIQV